LSLFSGLAAAGAEIPLNGVNGNGTYRFRVPKTGEWDLVMRTDSASRELFLRAMLHFDDRRPRERVVFSAIRTKLWDPILRDKLDRGEHTLTISGWPEGVRLVSLAIVEPPADPAVPEAVRKWRPVAVPLPGHPRVFFRAADLERVRKNLEHPENAPAWAALRKSAAEKLVVPRKNGFAWHTWTSQHSSWKFFEAVRNKAFYSLLAKDGRAARETASAMSEFLSDCDFDNLVLTSRNVGEVIYTGALLYDWCYHVLSKEEKDAMRTRLLELARLTEPRWPPFRQRCVISGHGSESQMMRDFLALAIAVYDEDPVPWQYMSYRHFVEIPPAKNYEYRSGRHLQGTVYGSYRFTCDLYAMLLIRAATGHVLLSDDFRRVPRFWLHLLRPDNVLFDAADANRSHRSPIPAPERFIMYAATRDPYLKGEFLRLDRRKWRFREGVIPYLLWNDPLDRPRPLAELELAALYGDPVSGFAARTAWSPDAAAGFFVGAPYHRSDHSHMDSGTFQIFHRAPLFVDLGGFTWGVPYDCMFARRTIAHSGGVLVYDPNSRDGFRGKRYTDGGQRLVLGDPPATLAELLADRKRLESGRTLALQAYPDEKDPRFCYMKLDLAPAYFPEQVRAFVRDLVWIATGDPANPALVLTYDRVESADPAFKKYYILNTLHRPEIAGDTVSAREKDGRADAVFLLPAKPEITARGDGEALNVFGRKVPNDTRVNRYLSRGWRTEISPRTPAAKDEFLCAIAVGANPPRPTLIKAENRRHVRSGKFLVSFAETPDGGFGFSLDAPARVIALGLKPGHYVCGGKETAVDANGTAYFELPEGKYQLKPKR